MSNTITRTINGQKYRLQLRPNWAAIFKSYGGFDNWKASKIRSLRAKGLTKLADWYETADFFKIAARDGFLTRATKL